MSPVPKPPIQDPDPGLPGIPQDPPIDMPLDPPIQEPQVSLQRYPAKLRSQAEALRSCTS